MSKLNKVLAMSLAALTLAGSSSQVFAARSRKSNSSESRKSDSRKSDSQKPIRRRFGYGSQNMDCTQYTETVKAWYRRLVRKVGESGECMNRAHGSAPTPDVVDAAQALLLKRGPKTSGYYESTVVMKHHRKRLRNDKDIYDIAEKVVKIKKANPIGGKKEIYNLLHENFSVIESHKMSGYLSRDFREIAQSFSDFYRQEFNVSDRIVENFVYDLIEKAEEQYPNKNTAEAVHALINLLIKLKLAAPLELKTHVDRLVERGSDLRFLGEIQRYVKASRKILAESVASRYKTHPKFKRSK